MRRLVAVRQRPYLAAHPLAAWFYLGIVLAGVAIVVDPDLAAKSSPLVTLPRWTFYAWGITYTVGGIFALLGIVRAWPKIEAAGTALLASAFLVNYVTTVYLDHTAAFRGLFVLCLSIGTWQRSYYLANKAQPDFTTPLK